MITLTPFTSAHFDQFISWIDSEELLVTIAGTEFSFPLTPVQLQSYLTRENSYPFAICDTEQNAVIGHAELLLSGPKTYKIDKLIIGDAAQRGKGRGEQVIHLLAKYAFVQLGASLVELNVFDWNTAGIRCYEKCGFTVNPGRTSFYEVAGQRWKTLNMLLRPEDWRLRKPAQQAGSSGSE